MKFKKLKSLIAAVTCALTLATICPVSVSAAWKQDSIGWWNTEGNSYSVGWRSINNTWYYFGSDGYMKTGWINDNSTWYYTDNSGTMKTGWINNNGIWYYTNGSGAMQTGWLNDNGTWYYTNESGAMQTGLVTINNNTYYLNESGAMSTGNVTINGVNYTFASSGEQISSTTTNETTTDNSNTSNSNTSNGSSGGSGSSGVSGGGSSSTSSKLSSSSSYSDLYGPWTVKSRVNSKIETGLTDKMITLCLGESFTIKEDKISSIPLTINNPIVDEIILTSSEFSDMFGDTLNNLGISGNKVKCITITEKDNSNHSADMLISDSGKVYAIVKGTVFALARS